MAAAVRPRRRRPGRPGVAGGRLSARRRRGGIADRRPVDSPRRRHSGGRADRCPAGRHRLATSGPTPQRRRRASRPVGAQASRPAGLADPPGCQRRPACRRDRPHRRALGPAGIRARDAPLAAAAQRPRRVARGRLRDRRRDAALPRLGRAGEASRGDRGAPVPAGHGSVRPAADRHPLRPDQHLFRRRGDGAAAGQARTLEREAQRLSAAHPGTDARRQRLRAPLTGLRR